MSKTEDKAKEFLKKLVSHTTLYKDTIDELEVYEPDDVIWAYKEGYQQAEKDLHQSIYKAGFLDGFEDAVEGQYEKGYEQAKKDLELSWEDLATIEWLADDFFKQNHKPMCDEEFYKEILKRFKDFKERKEK